MREKINQFAKGIFEYELSNVTFAPSVLEFEVESGAVYESEFTVSSSEEKSIRGVVVTDCEYLKFNDAAFQGEINKISYSFSGENLMPGEVVKGQINIISDCGTGMVPFCATVTVPTCTISNGKIKDLFHFANLARESEEEAIRLFKNSHFEDVFLYHDNANIALYRGLIAGNGRSVAMEEFLIAIRKKLPIMINVNCTSFFYDNCTEEFMEHIIITKDNWGYSEIHISSDTDFIQPEHKIIWTDNFVGNSYNLAFVVDHKKMAEGRNYGRIRISTVRQEILIDVTAVKPGVKHEEVLDNIHRQQVKYDLISTYLDFRMGKISREEYIHGAEKYICTLETAGISNMTRLFKLHMGIVDGRDEFVQEYISDFEAAENDMRENSPFEYGIFTYLRGMWQQNDDSNFRETEKKKFQNLFGMVDAGCASPIIYLEMCNLMNTTPGLLRELSAPMVQCLHWGCANNYLEKELATRYVYLAGRLKNFNKIILRDMIALYEVYPEDEVLAAVCRTCMKGQLTDDNAFVWYEKGIAANLKITDLYEYYMYSLDKDKKIHLNSSVLLYFLYDNHLPVSKKAMLYSYIIRHKNSDRETYEAYKNVIEEFCYAQLRRGRIDDDMSVIYEHFINEESIDSEIAKQLVNIMFCREIICDNNQIVGVYVRHQELEGEEFVPLSGGKAVVNIYTEHAQIFLADSLDNRYATSIPYTINQLVHLEHLADKCYEYNKDDERLLMYLYDRADHFNQNSDEIADIMIKMAELPDISQNRRQKIFITLLRYYYDNFEGELLDAELMKFDWKSVAQADREQIIEYCAIRRCCDKAMEGIRLFGYGRISAKRLLQISSDTFAQMREDEFLTKLAWHIYRKGKFDENILNYLVKYYFGSLSDMIELWKTVMGFGVETVELEEKIVAQIVFTEEIVPDGYDVFYRYYQNGTDKKLIKAFLKMVAYKYLVKDWLVPEAMFEYFMSEVRMEENKPCLIAVLKYLSGQRNLTDEQREFAEYNVNYLYENGVVFNFFKEFNGKISMPLHVMDEQYIEYITNPKCDVRINYIISSGHGEDEYISEPMTNMFEGIFVKEFVMFQDELLQYYITESTPDGDKITVSDSVHFDESMDSSMESSRYHEINLMLISQEMHDDTTLIDMMKEYAQTRESVNKLFKLK